MNVLLAAWLVDSLENERTDKDDKINGTVTICMAVVTDNRRAGKTDKLVAIATRFGTIGNPHASCSEQLLKRSA